MYNFSGPLIIFDTDGSRVGVCKTKLTISHTGPVVLKIQRGPLKLLDASNSRDSPNFFHFSVLCCSVVVGHKTLRQSEGEVTQ